MRTFIVICVLAVIGGALARSRPDEGQYTGRYDNTNIDDILASPRFLHAYVKCLVGEGRCTSEGRELKSHIKEALEDECAHCTEWQRQTSRKVMGHLIQHERAYWDMLVRKYDPQGKFTKRYEERFRQTQG